MAVVVPVVVMASLSTLDVVVPASFSKLVNTSKNEKKNAKG